MGSQEEKALEREDAALLIIKEAGNKVGVDTARSNRDVRLNESETSTSAQRLDLTFASVRRRKPKGN